MQDDEPSQGRQSLEIHAKANQRIVSCAGTAQGSLVHVFDVVLV
jgi:hypothetical protein